MATAIFSDVGVAVDGPRGQAIGAVAGGAIDRALTGTPGTAALGLQSSSYGEAIPRLYGTMRVSGGVIWSTGLRQEGSGIDKLAGGASGPTYSTNVAIGISARPILGVGRIWADGKLIRDGQGQMSVAGAVRVYTGAENQSADPLIVAVEGATGAPAYRGLAYVMFEDLQLGDFANHVPQFGFEVIADVASVTVGAIATDLFAGSGAPAPDASELVTTLDGYGVGGGTTLGGAIGQLAMIAPHAAVARGGHVALRTAGDAPALTLNEDDAGAYAGSHRAPTRVWRNEAAQRAPDLIELSYFDPARDYQLGRQAASGRRATRNLKTYDLPAAIGAATARALATRIARDAEAARATRSLNLPYAHCTTEVGDLIVLNDDPRVWRVSRQALDSMVVELDLEAWGGDLAAPVSADPGRSAENGFARQGATSLRLLDLPAFSDDGGTQPRLWLAVSGSDSWRAAQILGSVDGGASYTPVGVARTRAVMGTGGDPLGDGPANRWDEVNGIEVALADPHDWLTSASVDAVLGGANLAMIGGELIAFRNADATGTGKFRLSGLLRGRFGTEFATALHGGGEVFVLISPASLIQWSSAQASTGAAVLAKAVGSMEIAANVTAVGATLTGANLRPFAPVRVRVAREQDGTLQIAWTRRSRIGFGWIDGSDAPLGEATERYIVTLTSSLGNAQSFAAGAETLAILPAQQAAVAGGLVTGGQISVAQVSAIVGPGPAAILVFQF